VDDRTGTSDDPRDLVARVVSWTLHAVAHDLNGACAALPMLSSAAREAPDEVAEIADDIAATGEGLKARIARLQVLLVPPRVTSTVLDDAVATVLRLVGVAIRKSGKLVQELASGASVAVPQAVVSHALLVALHALTAGSPQQGVLRVTSSRGDREGVVSLESTGHAAPELEASLAFLRTLLDGRGGVEGGRTAEGARVVLRFALAQG
jgi:hypothetical protein